LSLKMKRTATLFCFVLLLALCLFEPVQGNFIETIYTAVLSPDSVVPTRSGTGGEGIAVCIYNRNLVPASLDCEVQYFVDSVFGPFYAGIYRGNPSQNGDLIYEFDVEIDSNFRQIFTLDDINIIKEFSNETYSSKQQEHDFLNGNWYIIISSPDYQFGDIRGSLKHEHFMYARMSNGNVVPKIDETQKTNSHGLAVGSYSYFNPHKTANFFIMHDVSNASRITINEGKSGEIGFSDFAFSAASTSLIEDIIYTSTTEEKLLLEEQYMQITSLTRPNGEIRSQIFPIDQLPPVAFTARLDGLSVLPNHVATIARGCGLFSLNCKTLRLDYLVYHTVSTPTGAWMNLGDRYTDGIKLWPLARNKGPIYGSRILTADEVIAFYQQRLYITIESLIYPEGEIRGQVSDTYNYYAYLTGTQLLPPLTTSSIGCATLRMDEVTNKGRILNYDVHFELDEYEEVSVELLHADVGLEGETLHTMGETFASISGTDVFLSNSEVNFVGTEKTYIQVGHPSNAGGAGKLRGQVYHIINPCPFLTSRPDDNPKTPTSSWARYEVPTYIEWGNSSSSFHMLSIIVLVIISVVFLL